MKKLDSIDDVGALFRDEPLPSLDDAARAEARRTRMIPAIEQVIVREAAAEKRRALRQRVGIGAALACAAAVALAVGWPGGASRSGEPVAIGSAAAPSTPSNPASSPAVSVTSR